MRFFFYSSVLLLLYLISVPTVLFAQEPQCAADSRITEVFENGAMWDFCWESRVRENLVISDAYYTPPNGTAIKVMGSARLSQLHVAYDDSDVTYNDITQYGLGGGYLTRLTEQDCPHGELVYLQSRAVLCQWLEEADTGFHTANRAHKTQSLHLFSVSQVGAYAYIINWTFYADGALQPAVGATGALQRSSRDIDSNFGRVLSPDSSTSWLSHTHTYYWRLDFDLGSDANDDVVTETRYPLHENGTRAQRVETLTTEQARRTNPDEHANWSIRADENPHSPSYTIKPIRSGHRFERTDVEPYSAYDFFVTVVNDCERFASQNARFNPDCHDNVLQYVDGQSISNKDVVLWHRVSFHHVPRKEDQRHMHTHWDGFMMRPQNVLDATDTLLDTSNSAPVLQNLTRRVSKLNDAIHEDINAADADGDTLIYSGSNLPPGISLSSQGHLHGTTDTEGSYQTRITVMDDQGQHVQTFEWIVNQTGTLPKRGGTMSFAMLLLILNSLISRILHRRFK